MTTTKAESTTRCDPSKVNVGAVFSRHSFGTVVSKAMGRAFRVRNQTGFEWEVSSDIVAQEFSFADQVEHEEEVSRTRAIEILTENPRTAMTVVFHKAVDPAEVATALEGGKGKDSDRAWKARVKAALAGEERTMVGYHTSDWDEHRRLKFHESGVGPRLVDPRTISLLTVDRVRYTVKK